MFTPFDVVMRDEGERLRLKRVTGGGWKMVVQAQCEVGGIDG